MAKEAVSELSPCPVTAKEAVCELLPCPVTAKEAICELSPCFVTVIKAVSELLFYSGPAYGPISIFSSCSEPAMEADCELPDHLVTINESDSELSVCVKTDNKSDYKLSVYPESTQKSVFLKRPDVESPVCSDCINSSDLVLSSCPVPLHDLFVSSVPVNAFGFEQSVHPISANTPCFESSAYLV